MKEDRKEVLKAWLDGKTIQFKSPYKCSNMLRFEWVDAPVFLSCQAVCFTQNMDLRIKPENIVTTTCIALEKIDADKFSHDTYSTKDEKFHNLKLTWSPDGETLLKAEVI